MSIPSSASVPSTRGRVRLRPSASRCTARAAGVFASVMTCLSSNLQLLGGKGSGGQCTPRASAGYGENSKQFYQFLGDESSAQPECRQCERPVSRDAGFPFRAEKRPSAKHRPDGVLDEASPGGTPPDKLDRDVAARREGVG